MAKVIHHRLGRAHIPKHLETMISSVPWKMERGKSETEAGTCRVVVLLAGKLSSVALSINSLFSTSFQHGYLSNLRLGKAKLVPLILLPSN